MENKCRTGVRLNCFTACIEHSLSNLLKRAATFEVIEY